MKLFRLTLVASATFAYVLGASPLHAATSKATDLESPSLRYSPPDDAAISGRQAISAGERFLPPVKAETGFVSGGFQVAATNPSRVKTCRLSYAACGSGIAAGALACIAVGYSTGGNPYATGAACLIGLADVGIACANVGPSCDPTIFSSSGSETYWTSGRNTDTTVAVQCDGEELIDEMKFFGKNFSADGLSDFKITKITIRCTDKSQYSIGRNEGTDSLAVSCAPGTLASAVQIGRVNNQDIVRRAQFYCRGLDLNGADSYRNSFGQLPYVPNPDQVQKTMLSCPEHSWMNGIAARRTNGVINNEYFTGVKLNCL